MQSIQLSIIIVNYNTKDLIFNCITSLKTKTQGLSYEIIVIDNASHDQSVEFLQEQFPDITIQALPENIGFGRANNIGANLAKGEVLFLLNSDTIIIDNSIKTLYDYLTTHPQTGVCGGLLLNADGSIGFSADRQLSLLHYFRSFIPFLRLKPFEAYSTITDVDYIVGADMMIKKEVFEKAGRFDPDFFLYCEETELCYRIRKLNYNIQLVPTAKIIHLEGKSSEGNQFVAFEKWYSRFLYFKKVYTPLHPYYLYGLYSILCFIALARNNWNPKRKSIWQTRYSHMQGGFKKYKKQHTLFR